MANILPLPMSDDAAKSDREQPEIDRGHNDFECRWCCQLTDLVYDGVFEVDLLKSQEINLDYILGLIFEHNRQNKGKGEMIEEVKRLIRSSLGNRAKEGLVVDFIQQTNLDDLPDKASIIDAFFTFAQHEQLREAEALIKEENLNEEAAKRYIRTSLKREYATENGTELNETLPKLSPLNPQYKTKKQAVFQKIVSFIEKFKGVGGKI